MTTPVHGDASDMARLASRLPRNGLAVVSLVLAYTCATAIRDIWSVNEAISAGNRAGLGVTVISAWSSWHGNWAGTAYAASAACLAIHAFACWARPYPTRRHATLPVALLVAATAALSGCLAVEFAAWMTRPPPFDLRTL